MCGYLRCSGNGTCHWCATHSDRGFFFLGAMTTCFLGDAENLMFDSYRLLISSLLVSAYPALVVWPTYN